MKNVCVLLDNPYTNDSRVEREINTLLSQGYHVTLIAWRKEADVPFEEKRGNLTIKRFDAVLPESKLGKIIVALRYGSIVPEKFIKLASAENCDVIHANDLPTLEPAYRVARKKKIPFIYDSHEIYLENMRTTPLKPGLGLVHRTFVKYNMWRKTIVEKMLAKKAAFVITVNEEIEKYLKAKYGLRKTLTLLNVPSKKTLDGVAVDIRSELGIAKTDKLILFHGSLSEKRGVFELARAAKLLPADYKILIMGYGPAKDGLEKIKNEESIANLLIRKEVPYDQLIPTIQTADLGIIPFKEVSLNQRFASPNKLFELLTAGVPILATDLPFMRSVIDKTGMGMTFSDVTDKGIAEAIKKFFMEFEMSKRDGYQSPYIWEDEETKLIKVYEEIFR